MPELIRTPLYLQAIADHPSLSTSQTLRAFLTNQSTFKNEPGVLQEIGKIAGGASSLSKFAKGLAQTFSTKTREPEFNDLVNYRKPLKFS